MLTLPISIIGKYSNRHNGNYVGHPSVKRISPPNCPWEAGRRKIQHHTQE